jgi:3-isopropylmalate dehydrogenase
MEKKITVIFGDGIGPEITVQSLKILNAIADQFNHKFSYDYQLMGAVAIDKTGSPLPDATIESCLKSDAVLFGAIGDPKYDNNPTAKVRPEQGLLKLRKTLQLYANIRPTVAYATLGHLSPLKPERLLGVDFIIFRELTSGIYFGEKKLSEDGTYASDLCEYYKPEIERIAHLAFQAAQKPERRQHLTLVDKANILETSRLWRKTVLDMAAQYPEVRVDCMFVDNAAMQIINNPKQFDVILTENTFGDIISDEASVIGGSLGLSPSASIGEGTALFEPIHGSYPQAAGKDIANPVASILSAAMMLEYFGMNEEAALVRKAVDWTLEHRFVTQDIDATNYYATSVIGDLIKDFIEQKSPAEINKKYMELGKSTII